MNQASAAMRGSNTNEQVSGVRDRRLHEGGNPFDALIVGCYDGGKLGHVGEVRVGFVPHMRCAMFPLSRSYSLSDTRLKTCRRNGNALFAD